MTMTDVTTTALCPLTHHNDPDRPRRPTAGLQVCEGHRRATTRHLAELAPLHRLLGETAALRVASIAFGSPGADTALPYRDDAARHRSHIRTRLVHWCLNIAQHRAMTVPSDGDPAHTVPWLLVHHHWTLAQDMIGEGDWQWTVADYAQDLYDLWSVAWTLAYADPRRRIPLALPCPAGCGGTLVARLAHGDDLLPDAECPGCGHTVPPSQWPRIGRGRCTAVELAAMWAVPLRTVQRWAAADRWPHTDSTPARYDTAAAQATFDRLRPSLVGVS